MNLPYKFPSRYPDDYREYDCSFCGNYVSNNYESKPPQRHEAFDGSIGEFHNHYFCCHGCERRFKAEHSEMEWV